VRHFPTHNLDYNRGWGRKRISGGKRTMSDIAFVSMPFGKNPESPENEWTKLFTYGLMPLQEPIDGLPENILHEPISY
jgi:hypothetical protein